MLLYTEYDYSKCTDSDIYTLDTETSSYWINPDSGVITGYDAKYSNDEYNNYLIPGACVYIWMIGINDTVVYGRELDDLVKCLKKIRLHCVNNPIIWVHNLAYDFQFLRNILSVDDMFARTVRKPIKFTANGFQFRCSYMLTRLSLESWAKKINIKGIRKQTGLLDYHVLRSPKTPLTDDELKYCEYDIIVMYYGILQFISKYQSQDKIPLTQTGEVRQVVKHMYAKDMGYKQRITKMQPKNVKEYKRLKAVFAGGDTHANRRNANKIHKHVGSFDKTSDYPYQLCAEKYACESFKKCSNDLSRLDTERYCYIIMVRLTNVHCKTSASFIMKSHCQAIKTYKVKDPDNPKRMIDHPDSYDNGRVLNAEVVSLACTELDWDIYCRTYDFDKPEVIAVYRARKKYLDKRYIEFILDLYAAKTSLKGIADKEDLYMQSKQFLNSLFGMQVTDILMPDVSFVNGEWHDIKPTIDSVNDKLQEIQDKWYKNNLAYAHGVWCTAYARHELAEAIIHVGLDECYHDTDSVKMLHYWKYIDYFKEQDLIMDSKLKAMCEVYDIDFERTRPLKPNGKPAPLGHWDFEAVYKQFKCLRAKSYAYNYGTEQHITVAGVPKSAGCLLKSLNDFKDGYTFDREKCGKKLLVYLDNNNPEVILPDGYHVHHSYAVNMRNNGYCIGLTDEYITLIQTIDEAKGIICDFAERKMV